MFCKNCGKELPQQATFCPYCGEKKAEPPNSAAVDAPGKKQPKQHKKKGLIVLSILVVLVAGILLVHRMTTNSEIASKLQGTDWWWSSAYGVNILRLNPDGTGVWLDSNHVKLTFGLVTYTMEEDHLILDEYEYQWNSDNEDVQKYTTEFYWDDDNSQFSEVDSIHKGDVPCTLTPADQGTFGSELQQAAADAAAAGEYIDNLSWIGDYYEGKLYNTICQGYWYMYTDNVLRMNSCYELTFNPNGVGSLRLRNLTTGEFDMLGNAVADAAEFSPFFYKIEDDRVHITMLDGDLLLCSLKSGKLVTEQGSDWQASPMIHYKRRPDASTIRTDSAS